MASKQGIANMFPIVKLSSFLLIIIGLFGCGHLKEQGSFLEQKNQYGLDLLMHQVYYRIEELWGFGELILAEPKEYLNYTDEEKTRSYIDFDKGNILIETISTTMPLKTLKQAIVNTLMLRNNPAEASELYTPSKLVTVNLPLLSQQVRDHEKKPISSHWRAERFADVLIHSNLKTRYVGIKKVWSVELFMVRNHLDERARHYLKFIKRSARKYGVDENLLLAIIEVESSFNPYAVSRSSALGLMQIKANSAGLDVFELVYKRPGRPSATDLFTPEKNIDIGAAYLHILGDIYLQGIRHPLSKRYAIIASYNGGAGSLLNSFSKNHNKSIKLINRLSPEGVYQHLTSKRIRSLETRNYLKKVEQRVARYKKCPPHQ